MPHLHFLQNVGKVLGSSTIFQLFGAPLRGIFTPLKVTSLCEHLVLVAFPRYNCCMIEMLRNTLYLLVFFCLIELQLGYLPLAPQYLCYDQIKVIWKIRPPNHHGSFISPTWTHSQIIPNTCTIFYEYNISHGSYSYENTFLKNSIVYLPIFGKRYPMLFTLNACFTNQ